MKAPITVCVGTYGDYAHWSELAHDRAMASVNRQTLQPEAKVWCHGEDLSEARNGAAADATSDWLCFLDADDELDERYLETMTDVIGFAGDSDALIQPSTLGVHPDGREDPHPVLIPPRDLRVANFLVIGTLIRTEQFHRLGGFHDWPCLEDWDLWLRAWSDGAKLLVSGGSVYRVHLTADSRNACTPALKKRTAEQIRRRHQSRTP